MFWLLLFLIPFVYAEPIPDYYNPYSPIITDKSIYSWTDKVKITVLAPSWNADRYLIDDIGADSGHHIKISTRDFSLEPYRLTETDVNNGIFTGEVILTGFLHDADGDGDFDTVPKTSGSGPTNGFLETKHDSAITISFEFADGVIVTESVPISWNVATLQFFENNRTINDTVTIRLVDADMNLNPEGIDTVTVDVFSDTDIVGLKVDVIETRKDSGIFETDVLFSHDGSSGNRLFLKPGDQIIAKYEDRTLPSPYGTFDQLDIVAQTDFVSDVSPTARATINPIRLSDGFGNNISNIVSNQQIQIVGSIQNNQNFAQSFVYLIQIKNDNDTLVKLAWISGSLQPDGRLDVSQSWLPKERGTYIIESFVWDSISSMSPLSNSSSIKVTVK